MKTRPVPTRRLRPALIPVLVLATLAVVPLGSSRLLAQATPAPPERLTYQGFLVDGNGLALGNAAPKNYDVTFRIFNDQSAGNLLWAEQQTVTVEKGYFSVLLGEGASTGEPRPVLSTLFRGPTASDRFVGITVKGIGPGGANVDILPRLRLLSSPYAFLAQNAMKLVQDTGADLITSSGNAVTVGGPVTATSFIGSGETLTGVAQLAGGNTFSGNQTFNNSLIVGSGDEDFSTRLYARAAYYGRGDIRLFAGKEGSSGIATIAASDDTTTSNIGLNLRTKQGSKNFSAVWIHPSGRVGINGDSMGGQFTISHNETVTYDGGWPVKLFNYDARIPEQTVFTGGAAGMRVSDVGFLEMSSWMMLNESQGFARLDSTGAWTKISDRRIKTDIQPAEPMLDKALGLRPVRFHFRFDTNAPLQLGFIAQEVEPSFPTLVTTGGDFKTVDYSTMSVVAVGALQELNQKLEQTTRRQDAEIAQLKGQLAELKTQMTEVLQAAAEMKGQVNKARVTAANNTGR